MCAFLSNGHIKVKLLVMFLSTEGKPAVFGFSFSVHGAVVIPLCLFHHKMGAKGAGDETKRYCMGI